MRFRELSRQCKLATEDGREDVHTRGVQAVAKIYPPFMVAGKEQEGYDTFSHVDGMAIFWNDLTGFLAESLKS
jgi:hypothetical protein